MTEGSNPRPGVYCLETTVRMADTDAAGVIYFARQLELAHHAFEAFLEDANLGVGHMLAEKDYRIPIVHAESDYRAPLRVGDKLTICLTAQRIGDTSFTLNFRLRDHAFREVGAVKTVHVAVSGDTWKKRPIPAELRAALDRLVPGP
ncbi:MAG TPA: thioesterase family protein [Kiritimatiellia bacterium]|mgnify:FL=1|nr:thioesterase family protein [Kiritimatiellia bacterium]